MGITREMCDLCTCRKCEKVKGKEQITGGSGVREGGRLEERETTHETPARQQACPDRVENF